MNALGYASPILVALACYPMLIRSIGLERFALLALSWTVVGYFSVFDMGLGRALTRLAARHIGAPDNAEFLDEARSLLMALTGLGVIGALVPLSLLLVDLRGVVQVNADLVEEVRAAILWLSPGALLTIITAGLRGVLEGFSRFGSAAALRALWGILQVLIPASIALVKPSLPLLILGLVLGRAVLLLAHLRLCQAIVPGLFRWNAARIAAVSTSLRFGGWITVSSLVSPVLTTADRFLIGTLLPLEFVTYYTTAFDTTSRILIVPSSVGPVLFQRVSQSSRGESTLLVDASKIILFVEAPLVLLGMLLAEPLLGLWLGADFAGQAAWPMRILLVAFLVNSFAQVPYAHIQARGHSRTTALIHLTEIVPYGLTVYWMTREFGITGAALAWFMRAMADYVALHLCSASLARQGCMSGPPKSEYPAAPTEEPV